MRERPVRAVAHALVLCLSSGAAANLIADAFERLLVPVSVNGVSGAYGSIWSTELWYRNNSTIPVAILPLPISHPVPTVGRTERLHIGYFPAHAPGQILFLSRPAGRDVQFDLRLFNRAAPDDQWGTKIPVVREDEFSSSVNLINVPTSDAFRSALRVYALEHEPGRTDVVRVHVYSHDERLLASTGLILTGVPRYAQILSLSDAFPNITEVDRVRVHVESATDGLEVWALVSVVSNETQRVVVVTPQ